MKVVETIAAAVAGTFLSGAAHAIPIVVFSDDFSSAANGVYSVGETFSQWTVARGEVEIVDNPVVTSNHGAMLNTSGAEQIDAFRSTFAILFEAGVEYTLTMTFGALVQEPQAADAFRVAIGGGLFAENFTDYLSNVGDGSTTVTRSFTPTVDRLSNVWMRLVLPTSNDGSNADPYGPTMWDLSITYEAEAAPVPPAVPLPAGMLLLGTAFAGTGFATRRRRKD